MELPEPQRDIKNNKDEIEMVQSIISGINYWYDENTINMIHFNSIVPEKSEVIEFLDSYVRLCKKVIDGIVENPQIDDKKISYIKNELFEYEKVNIENIVTDKSIFLNDLDINSYESRSFSLPYSYRLNKSDICEGYRGFIVDLKRILTQGLFNNLQRYYASFFINVKSCAEYSIQYSDMLKALNKLKLDSKQHVIFSQGVSFSDFELIYGSQENLKTCGRIMTYNNTQIINMPSQERLLLVMRKADVPFYNFQTKKDGGELSLKTICPNSFLYSNLDDLDLTDPILELVYYLNFYYKENFNYVRIKISNDFPVGNRGDIDKIRSFI